MRRALILVAALLCSGCSLSPSADVIQALAKDPATGCFKVHAIYGVGNGDVLYARTNCTNCAVTCTSEGMTVKTP
jgi:hypothetical protein